MPDEDSPHLSLRSPWPQPDPRETSLSTLIPRIFHQRGHFKDVNEAILEAEIAVAKESEHGNDNVYSQSEPLANGHHHGNEDINMTENTEGGEVDRATQLRNAKMEMLALVGQAREESLFALDYVSLLVSLQQPEVGATSMSPALRAGVPVGSFGFDRVQYKVTPQAATEDAIVTRTWKADALNSAADTLLTASQKLGGEVQKEAKYWAEVLTIRDDGWLITRMPRERHTLGVRYGFAESAPEYKNKGISALRRGENGNVIMEDADITGSRSRAMLRVRILENNDTIGMSVQNSSALSSALKDTIECARDFVYEDELFFEIMREARILASQGIRTSEDAVTIELGRGRRIVLDMAALDVEPAQPETIRTLDDLAQGMAIAFRLLLSYNHRLNLQRRSKPPPPLSSRKATPQPLWLVRPITNHVYHQQHLEDLRSVLLKLQSFAKAAGLNTDFLLTPLKNCRNLKIEGVESAVETFTTMLETTGTVLFPGGWKLNIIMRTLIGPPTFGTGYSVGATHDGMSAKLMGESRFSSIEELQLYLCWCLERSIVNEIRVTGEWRQEAQDNEMVRSIGDKKVRRIRIVVSGQGLEVSWFNSGRSDRYLWDGEDHQTSLLDVLRGL